MRILVGLAVAVALVAAACFSGDADQTASEPPTEPTTAPADGVMYMPNPRDVIQAIDAATGDLTWEYRRSRPDDVDDFLIASLSETNRNLAIYGNLIIDTSGRRLRVCPGSDLGAAGVGKRRSSTTRRTRPIRPRGRSSPTARSSRNGAVRRGAGRRRASSRRTMRRRGRSCGAGGRFPRRASRGMRRGATCRLQSGSTWAPRWCRVTTRR